MSKIYEVYVCKLGDEVLYVGQGEKGRHRHCNSGCSHSYELNKLHFLGNVFDVNIEMVTKDKKEALTLEFELIRKLKPKFNKNFCGSSNTKVINKRNRSRNFFQNYPKENKILVSNMGNYLSLVGEFFDFHKGEISIGGSEMFLSRESYKRCGYDRLSCFARYLTDSSRDYFDKNYCSVFHRAFEEHYGFHPKYLLDTKRIETCKR